MLTTAEAATRLEISRVAVTTAILLGLLPAAKHKGRWMIDEGAVIQYQQEHNRPGHRVLLKDGMRCCSRCKKHKPLNEFVKDRRKVSGYESRCKDCHREIYKERRQKPHIKEHEATYRRNYYEKHREQLLAHYRHRVKTLPYGAKQQQIRRRKKLLKLFHTAPGYVYLVKLGEYYKIGITKSIKRRLGQLQTGSPFSMETICAISTDYTRLLEQQLHELFRDRHVKGEWFVLNANDVDYLISIAG